MFSQHVNNKQKQKEKYNDKKLILVLVLGRSTGFHDQMFHLKVIVMTVHVLKRHFSFPIFFFFRN